MKKKSLACILLGSLLMLSTAVGCDFTGGGKNNDGDNPNVNEPNTPNNPNNPNKPNQPGNPNTPDDYEEVDYTASHTSSNRFVNFVSSDEGLDDFLNEYAERHMRDNAQTRVGDASVGDSTRVAWREWDSLIGGWWDASSANGTMSKAFATNDAVNAWFALDDSLGVTFPSSRSLMDNQGYIWCDTTRRLDSWGMGWDFPDYRDGGKSWDFTSSSGANDWPIETSNVTKTVSASKLQLATTAQVDEITISTTNFGLKPCYTPFLRIGFGFTATGQAQIDDLYVEWKTSDDNTWSNDKKVKFSEFSTRGFEIGSSNVEVKDYVFPMYLNDKWGANFNSSRTITALRITLKGVEKFRGTLSYDFIASEYDDRQPINNCNYIIAAKNNLEFSRDEALLRQLLPNARKAMNFLLYTLGGNEGLISTEYLVGHFSNRGHARGTGIGNGYWDVDAFPTVNLYCNTSFYNALVAMKYLEDMADYMGINFEPVQTENANMDGYDTYSATTKSNLSNLIFACKRRIQTEFWNAETGRFHVGYYDDNSNSVQDHGYVMFNEQVITSGIATQQQTESILKWINGERTVNTDNSKGNDIYYYEIAPRFNTQDIGADFVWKYACDWDGNVQNGGTALHLAYYDILAQSAGSNATAYSKLKNLQAWFEKVKAAGGQGKAFYREYYNNYTSIQLQGRYDGVDHSGLVGVDCEFMEAALVFRSVPDAFFGMSTSADGMLNFAPALPNGMTWWRMENLVYAGNYYDVSIGKYFLQISGVTEYSAGSAQEDELYLTATFPIPSFDYAVYMNGTKVNSYMEIGNQVQIMVPFGNVKLEIKPE